MSQNDSTLQNNIQSASLPPPQQILLYANQSLTFTVDDVRWIPDSPLFVAVGAYPRNTAVFRVYRLGKSCVELVQDIPHPVPIKCCSFGVSPKNQRHLAMGHVNGMLRVVDIDRPDAPLFTTQAHNSLITRCDAALYSGPPEVATSGRDGYVRLWDIRLPQKPVAVLEPADPAHASEAWAVAIGGCAIVDDGATGPAEDRCIAAGYMHGDIKILDLRAGRLRYETNVGNGVCWVSFDRPDIPLNKLNFSMLEGRVGMLDLRTIHPTEGCARVIEKVHTGTVWTIRALPQCREVAVSGGGGDIAVLRYQYPTQRSLKGMDGLEHGVPGKINVVTKV